MVAVVTEVVAMEEATVDTEAVMAADIEEAMAVVMGDSAEAGDAKKLISLDFPNTPFSTITFVS